MKVKLFIILLFFIAFKGSAADYYIDSIAGNDSNSGLTTLLAWQTMGKVNSTTFSPGDNIYFKRGQSWKSKLVINASGTSGNRITYGAYGSGDKPRITALERVSGFINQGGNIWVATVSNSVKNLNVVLVDGIIRYKGRYPNVASHPNNSTLAYDIAYSTTNKIVITGSNSSNYLGAEIVIAPQTWVLDVCKIRSQVVDSLYVSPYLVYGSTSNRYFLQNLPQFCDIYGEWAYDSTNKVLSVYSISEPTDVQISTIDTLCHVLKKDYITFDGLAFIGANSIGVYRDTSHYVTIQNCLFNWTGGNNPDPVFRSGLGGAAVRGTASNYAITRYDTILNSLNNAIFDIHGCGYDSVYDNYIRNTGILAGMACGSNGAATAIYQQGTHFTCLRNRIDSVGYVGIFFAYGSDTTLVKNNYITYFNINKADGGGIYTIETTSKGSRIISNIILHGVGGWYGNVPNLSPGIYLDGSSSSIIVDSNTVDDCYLAALWMNFAKNSFFRDNTIRNGRGVGFRQGIGSEDFYVDITRNIFYQLDSTYAAIQLDYGIMFTGSTSDTNWFIAPSENKKFYNRSNSTFYSRAGWTAFNGYEAHSLSAPTGITSEAGILLINPTIYDSTFNLNNFYIGAKGEQYSGTVTIKPFQSKLLFISSIARTGRIGNFNFKN